MEILKLIVAFLSGGLAGSLVNEFFKRRASRLQSISLIERVNRKVQPELRGITLARVTTEGGDRRLGEVANLREYQLTLRNTSKVHLKDVEVQFEFPASDMEAWASRPARSQTALVPVSAEAAPPLRRAFRWRVPHLPVRDSIEFTFQAIDAESGEFVVTLYGAENVVINRLTREPEAVIEIGLPKLAALFAAGALALGLSQVAAERIFGLIRGSASKPEMPAAQSATPTPEPASFGGKITGSGCELLVLSETYPSNEWKIAVWQVNYKVLNIGNETCTVDWPGRDGPRQVKPGLDALWGRVSTVKPPRIKSTLSFFVKGKAPTNAEIDSF